MRHGAGKRVLSSVFRISVRGRGAMPRESGVWRRGLGPLFTENHFCPQSDMFGCVLTQFLTGRKYGQSLIETLGHGFYGSVAKRSLQKLYKNYPKNYGQTKWGRRSHHHPLPWIRHCKCHMKWCTSQLTWYVYCHWRTGHVTAIVHQRVNFGSKHFFIQLLLTTVIIRKKWGECVRNNRKTRGYSRMYLTLSVPTGYREIYSSLLMDSIRLKRNKNISAHMSAS